MTGALDHLRHILDHSLAMEACAREGRWEDLLALEAERAALIAAWCPDSGDANDEPAACLARIVEVNERLTRLSEEQRDRLMEALRGSRRKRRAVNSYEAGARTF